MMRAAADAALLRQRNRRLVWILIAAMIAVSVWGVLYLRHYGFAEGTKTEQYH